MNAGHSKDASASGHSAIKIPLHRRYARFFDRVGWFWEYKPKGFRLKPDFLVEFVCRCRDYSTHPLFAYIDDKATDLNQLVWSISRSANRSPYDVPHVAVFGEHPRNSHWEMVHGDGGGFCTIADWIDCDIDVAWAAAA